MKVVLQRARNAELRIDSTVKSTIEYGIMLLVGIIEDDTDDDIEWMARKIVNLRIFDDKYGVMNLSINDLGLDLLVVSQFTLHASTRKGNRPSYIKAAKPDVAIPIYERFLKRLEMDATGNVVAGEFGADMKITFTNDGPVTIIIDSKEKN